MLIPGLTVYGPGDDPSCTMDPRDYRPRHSGEWVRQNIVHTTKGIWPQKIVEATRRGQPIGLTDPTGQVAKDRKAATAN